MAVLAANGDGRALARSAAAATSVAGGQIAASARPLRPARRVADGGDFRRARPSGRSSSSFRRRAGAAACSLSLKGCRVRRRDKQTPPRRAQSHLLAPIMRRIDPREFRLPNGPRRHFPEKLSTCSTACAPHRKNWMAASIMAIVMGFIVVSFAIWGIGDIFRGFGAGKLAKVGSTEISDGTYRYAYQNELQRLQQQAGRVVTNEQARAIGLDRQVLGRLVTEAALDQRAQTLGLYMSDAQVAKSITDRPDRSRTRRASSTTRFELAAARQRLQRTTFVREQQVDLSAPRNRRRDRRRSRRRKSMLGASRSLSQRSAQRRLRHC